MFDQQFLDALKPFMNGPLGGAAVMQPSPPCPTCGGAGPAAAAAPLAAAAVAPHPTQPPPPGHPSQPAPKPGQPGFDFCTSYKQVRPLIDAAIPILKGIPVIGAPMANALQSIVSACDSSCNISSGLSVTAGSAGGGLPNTPEFADAVATFHPVALQMGITPANVGQDLCSVYKLVRPILPVAIAILPFFPPYGPAIAAGLTVLQELLDFVCKAQLNLAAPANV